jgi:uncharacterized membrane protein YphA (DoxX/SURF4 family)
MKWRWLKNDYLHLVIRLIMGSLFIWAGLGKIVAPLDFAASIYNYKLFPEVLIGLTAAIIPWLETLAGVSLILGVRVKGGSLVISVLLLLFISLIAISWVRGLDVECGCFSGVERTVGLLAIAEDLVMLAGALFVLFFDQVRITPTRIIFRKPTSR